MQSESFNLKRPLGRTVAIVATLTLFAGCAADPNADPSAEIYDPYESANRKVHEFNRGVDRALFRPLSKGYGTVVPDGGRQIVSNFADNLSLPADIINNLLQGDVKSAGNNTYRFVFNTVVGIGGLADPATEFGIPRRKTDFGETFHVWGAEEGAYVELPLLGPSNQRDAVGTVLDFALDPVSMVVPNPEKYVGTAANVMDKLGDRYDAGDAIDTVLYESADSYAQAQSLYLQNRRFELGDSDQETYVDLYDDLLLLE